MVIDMSSVTIIDIPLFTPQYESDKSYGYKGINGERLLELLYKTTKGYCMYCYCKINIDTKKFGHLEHAIEKDFCKKSYLNVFLTLDLLVLNAISLLRIQVWQKRTKIIR